MTAQLKEIVDRLNAEPFTCGLSLLEFDELEALDLMETLKKVLVFLDPKHDVDLREEKPEAMYQRMAEFLHILGYQCPFDTEFQQGLTAGEKSTIHPILYWALSNLAALKKRAYLAKFCMNLEVPEEFLRDEKVFEMFQTYKELQSQFKATHAHVEQERQGRLNPEDLQREVVQLDSEREQLAQKIQQLRHKSERDEGFQQLLQVTSMLRKEQEEEARLAEKLEEQRFSLEQTEQTYIERSGRLREMREAQQQDGGGSAEAMLKMLRNEVTKGREALTRVQKEEEEKLDRLREVDAMLSEPPVTQGNLDNFEGEISDMRNKTAELEERINEHNQDPRLAVYRQQANLVAKKKEGVTSEHRRVEEERDTLSKELNMKEREYEQMKGHKFMKRDEFKKYAESLREKSGKFKRLKTELSELRAEVAVVRRTEELLQAKDPTPKGMREAEAKLEKASVEKSKVDSAKGKTLDEISSIVQKINQQLKEKKNKLAPQIKALRSVRQKFQEVEVRYLEKKGIWDQAKSNTDGELCKVAGEVKQLDKDVVEAEQSYHDLNMQICLFDSKLQRAHRETLCMAKEERHSQNFATLADQYTTEIKKLDDQCVQMRKDQQDVKDSHKDMMKQKKAFVQLEMMMRVKLKVAKQEMQNMTNGRYGGVGGGVAMEERTAGVERLVIDGTGWEGS